MIITIIIIIIIVIIIITIITIIIIIVIVSCTFFRLWTERTQRLSVLSQENVVMNMIWCYNSVVRTFCYHFQSHSLPWYFLSL